MTTASRVKSNRSRARWTALVALLLWGVVHIIGGVSLLAANANDGLKTLGPNVSDSVPANPGDATEALLRFHSLNVVLGGLAVLGLAVAWWRSGQRWQLDAAVAVAAALDIGLIAFFVIPDVLPASQGLVGPLLVIVAAVGAVGVHRQTRRDPAIASPPTA